MRRTAAVTLAAALALTAFGCSSGDDTEAGGAPTTAAGVETTTTAGATTSTSTEESTTTTALVAVEPFTILVSDDDGVAAPGIDALVEGLRTLEDIRVVVVAPADEQSGTGGSISDTPPAATETTTASGYPAVAVAGFPADAVTHALDVVFAGTQPDLVISGINRGQNLGPAIDLSGTIGAARVAASRGIPTLAVSQGLADEPDFAAGVEEALAWLEEHRDSLVPGTVANLNVPTCTDGERQGPIEVEADRDGDIGLSLGASDCTIDVDPRPTEDVAAFLAGYVTLTDDIGVTPADR